MTGAVLIGFIILGVILLIIASFVDRYDRTGWVIVGAICLVIAVIMALSIPGSRLETQADVEYARVFQETLDFNREQPQQFNVIERATVLEEIGEVNRQIINWQTKGDKWYQNKWYYHEDTKNAVLVK